MAFLVWQINWPDRPIQTMIDGHRWQSTSYMVNVNVSFSCIRYYHMHFLNFQQIYSYGNGVYYSAPLRRGDSSQLFHKMKRKISCYSINNI